MAIVRWDPGRDLDLLQSDVNRLFDAFFGARGTNRSNGGSAQRERRYEHENRHEGFYRVERSFGRFSRSLDLPSGIEAEALRADFDRGVLEVHIPKPEQGSPTRVPVGAGSAAGTED